MARCGRSPWYTRARGNDVRARPRPGWTYDRSPGVRAVPGAGRVLGRRRRQAAVAPGELVTLLSRALPLPQGNARWVRRTAHLGAPERGARRAATHRGHQPVVQRGTWRVGGTGDRRGLRARRGAHERLRQGRDAPARRRVRDRKSTRLNSSHTVISYAVFCLKKKKKKEQIISSTD